ncbi:origin recognition complex subunit 5 C-terminus-domain-containing protein [Neurospora tetraspora]|uniref:Origin recognition complex subunit 5 C-terminus-domain-containing protein n=1 Tax=Neurospora tetraspora TaxID=94610 RepID=A0AAE0JF09_9PEZI|nr:origin recognition complex subunit 5 C-terminus-domain-containing protein [Neurospora tetraspora]
MGDSLFQLPDELLFTTLSQTFPCRDAQIRAVATLLHPHAAPCQNLVIHGTEATGKSAITAALLQALQQDTEKNEPLLRYVIISSIECITARHIYESTIAKVAEALQWQGAATRCDSVSQMLVELSKMLKYPSYPANFRFVLVFDGIDRQREAPITLLPALARLSEIIPRITSVFIVTSPPASFLRTSFVPCIEFPNYTKNEFVTILNTTSLPTAPLPTTTIQETTELWNRFTGAIHDALARAASRTLPSLQHACTSLWPRFTAPILAGTHAPREFSKLMVAARVHFQDESLLDPGIVAIRSYSSSSTTTQAQTKDNTAALPSAPPSQANTPRKAQSTTTTPSKPKSTANLFVSATTTDLSTLLPPTARLLLLASYLASHNPTRHDLVLFSTFHHGRRRRRGGLSVGMGRGGHRGAQSKHRKIARKLLGAHAFVLERMLAIFTAVRGEWDPKWLDKDSSSREMDADIEMAIATLASLRLLVRVGGAGAGGVAGDQMDRGGKWRCNVGWEVVRGLGRSMGVEVEEWLVE